MGRMTCAIAAFAVVSIVFLGCSTNYMTMRQNMFSGRRALEEGDYARAEQLFLRSAQAEPSPQAYAFAATAAYKANDLPNAERFVDEALRLDGNSYAYMRMLAYRSLILLKEGRSQEGVQALDNYLSYGNYYPMPSYGEVRQILSSGAVYLPRLEQLLDDEVRTYESDYAQYYGEGTGYLAEKYYGPVGHTVPER
ncbi:MAG: hypothetical protein ABSE25_12245 [Syntrophorhabdales bacterium]